METDFDWGGQKEDREGRLDSAAQKRYDRSAEGNGMNEKRILLTVGYDGTDYCGWQYQDNGPSIQAALEEALRKATGAFARVTGASRTDAGVHARGQRAHFDTAASIPAEKYPFVLNRFLPEDIRVTKGMEVAPDFHARFMAAGKWYAYRIHNAAHPDALFHRMTAHVPLRLDDERMRRCGEQLLGTHDFAAFAAAGGQAKTTVRTIDRFSLVRTGDELTIRVHGDGFLYNMVRIIAGTLIDVGHGKLPEDCISRAIASKNRLDLGITAPAKGLELTRVEYGFEKGENAYDPGYPDGAF